MTHFGPWSVQLARAGTRHTVRRLPIDEREQQLRQAAENFATSMGQQFDVEFDFTPQSLIRLDGWLTQWVDLTNAYSADQPENIMPVALSVTAYAGEVIRRNLDRAVWVTEEEEDQISPPHVRLANGMRINLMKKSIQILTGTDSPSFAEYYRTITGLASDESDGTGN